MERFIILVIWVIGITLLRNANTKSNERKTKTRTTQQKRKNVFGTIREELEKEKQRLERPTRPARSSMLSDLSKQKSTSKPKTPPVSEGLEIDIIGGDEEIGGINEAGISIGSKYNKLDFDLKRDIIKGIIYSEILSEPKSLRNMKKRVI